MDWLALTVSLVALAVFVAAILVFDRWYDRRWRRTVTVLTTRVDLRRARIYASIISAFLALLSAGVAADNRSHRLAAFFGALLVEGALVGVYGLVYSPSQPLEDMPRSAFNEMPKSRQRQVRARYAFARQAPTYRNVGKFLLPVGAVGLVVSLVLRR